MLNKRDFIAAAIALAASSGANAQTAGRDNATPRKIPRGMMKTTRMFKSPPGHANGMAVVPEGLWLAQQKLSGESAKRYGVPQPSDLREAAWLVDWNGKLLKTVMTNCRNCSGMAAGGGYLWMMANQEPFGCFQVDMNGKQISHRQIPLAMPGQNGGGSHGAQWHNGKLWIAALRPKLLIRVDPKTWMPEVAIAAINSPDKPRSHDLTFDANGDIWLVTGNDSKNYKEGKPGLTKYDGKTGQVIGFYDFLPGSADPHGLEFHNGTLISCDAGIHPGWPNGDSPHAGWVFKIEPA